MTGEFTNVEIEKITKPVDIEMMYGNLEISEVPDNFESIKIKDKFGTIEIGINEAASYKLSADLKLCELEYPESDNISVSDTG